MRKLDVTQKTDEWLAARAQHFTASEAPAMMGAHPSVSRNDLLRAKYSGADSEISHYVLEVIFGRGHEAEAAVRPAAETEVDGKLFPLTVTDDNGDLLASLDGITLDETTLWEGKQHNQDKVNHIAEHQTCPPQDYWQVMQQLMITGAERCLYTVGNDPETVVKLWVYPDEKAFKALQAGWKQFRQDLADYQPSEADTSSVGRTMETLPALHIEMKGEVTASNLSEYKSHALAVFDRINTDLQTDQDFADAEQIVKWCTEVENRLDAAKQHALSQTADIDALFRAIDDIKESAKRKRLELNKRVQERKQSIRVEIRQNAEQALAEHIKHLESRLDNRVPVPSPDADFGAAMKNKRTIQSLHDAVDQVLASAKIEASATADAIQSNLKAFDQTAADYTSLFPDLSQIVCKQPDDFTATVKLRISEHQEAEKKRAEKPRTEEQEKATVEPNSWPTPTADSKLTWNVVCTFQIETGPGATNEQLVNKARQTLEKAGVTTLVDITATQQRRVA